jgi:hypothetical protein
MCAPTTFVTKANAAPKPMITAVRVVNNFIRFLSSLTF